MDDKLLIKKIQALLHDPPEKPIILGKIGHEGKAKEQMAVFIDEARIPEDVRTADYIAAAADRVNLPKDEKFIADFRRQPVIKHPLSAREFDLKSLALVDINDITATVDRAIVYLEDKYKNDNERIYLALWRELVERLKTDPKDAAKLGQLWELLPADTRIPDHSIWEHKRVASAIAGALPKPAFLLFSIGPVQEFIAAARKTQDLWAGSYLLSYLSWCAMKVVAEEFGPDSLIFPDLCGQPVADLWLINDKRLTLEKPNTGKDEMSSPTLPNRFLAIVPADSVKDIAGKAKKQVHGTFLSACQAVKEAMEAKLGIKPDEWDNIWNRQTSDFIETYCAATTFVDVKDCAGFISEYKQVMGITDKWEFDDLLRQYEEKGFAPNIGTTYGQIYRLTEKALGSRKTVRDFKQQNESNHKCTLCGVREPVHPGMYKNQNCTEEFGALTGFWRDKILSEFSQIRKSERLCAVCITKRLVSKYYFKDILKFDITDNFPSVSMVATAAFKLRVIENINHNHLSVKAGNYIDAVKNIAGERWSGIPMPMVIRACRDEISRDFARLEGDWLYKEAFDNEDALWEDNKNKFEKADFKELLRNAKEKQKELFVAIKEFDKGKDKDTQIGTPSTYYAILLMDGDNMGKWLSGDFAPKIGEVMHPIVRITLATQRDWQELLKQNRPLNPSLHLATSKALRDFSLHVAREIVEKDHLGKLVYAGGDDVLAFVSLRDLPEVMRKLRAYFSGSLKVDEETNKVDVDFKGGKGFIPIDDDGIPLNVGNNENQIKGFRLSMGTNATASMGVVIAHHNSNLSQVLDEVRKCEKEAKKKTGFLLKDCGNDDKSNEKNAFCIALAKRAGGTEHVNAKWYYDLPHFDDSVRPTIVKGVQGGIFESIPLLRQWADAFYNDHLSPKIIYTFRTETKGLEGLPHQAIKLELMRIADRQRNKKAHGFEKKDLKDLVDGIMNLHAGGLSLDDISKFLSVAAFLGREGNR
jgi:CRISPR-associated protein Cmr2